MKRIAVVTALFLATVAWAIASDLVGKWDMVAKSTYGERYDLILTLQETDGKLGGTLGTPQGTVTLQDVTQQGDQLSFKVIVGGSSYEVEVKVDGDSMDGTYAGAGSGSVTAKRSS